MIDVWDALFVVPLFRLELFEFHKANKRYKKHRAINNAWMHRFSRNTCTSEGSRAYDDIQMQHIFRHFVRAPPNRPSQKSNSVLNLCFALNWITTRYNENANGLVLVSVPIMLHTFFSTWRIECRHINLDLSRSTTAETASMAPMSCRGDTETYLALRRTHYLPLIYSWIHLKAPHCVLLGNIHLSECQTQLWVRTRTRVSPECVRVLRKPRGTGCDWSRRIPITNSKVCSFVHSFISLMRLNWHDDEHRQKDLRAK